MVKLEGAVDLLTDDPKGLPRRESRELEEAVEECLQPKTGLLAVCEGVQGAEVVSQLIEAAERALPLGRSGLMVPLRCRHVLPGAGSIVRGEGGLEALVPQVWETEADLQDEA